ncbi:hypothetical protein PINS_up005112 [Pythium insidiosum]|nr:hypothetical protein PINS_up005112 [Pythium insidiosum]
MYSIRVTGFNAKGAGRPQVSEPPSVLAANQVPTVPRNLQLTVASSTSLNAAWQNPLYDGGSSLKSYEVQWDEQDDFSSGQSSSATIPIIREMQSVTLASTVVNEEQFVDATVEVINEVQVVRTSFSGADEIQIVQTTNDAVVDEVQTVTTTATDRDEVQELRLDGDDVNEIQAVRTTVDQVFEVHTIQIGAVRQNEVQTITIRIPGAAADTTLIGGQLYFSFDNTICTHCSGAIGYRRTTDLVATLRQSDSTLASAAVEAALEALDNIDSVDVTRSVPTGTAATDIAYTYTITFAGDEVAGDVPSLVVDSSLTYNNVAVAGVPTVATEATKGNELFNDPNSMFGITHTCESYSDPYAITSFSTACTPNNAALLCATCVTAFSGTAFTTSTSMVGNVVQGNRLIAGICVFEVDTVAATTITVKANDVGLLCSTFTGAALPLYRAVQYSTTIPVKTTATRISDATVIQNLLNTIIDSVTVTRTSSITNTFVGSLYDVTFRKRSGSIPLLLCDATSIQVTSGGKVCSVTRKTIGSMIAGTFTLSLAKQSDGTVVTTPAIPWDASETLLKSTLESVVNGGEQVFGTVTVRRSVFSPTGDKWSGGYTWQIEFTSRGWNIPKMSATSALVNSDANAPAAAGPSVLVEDAGSPFNPFAGSRHGNQVAGSITFTFRGATTIPCVIGTNTDITSLTTTVVDTTMSNFLRTQLAGVLPSVVVTRSAATQSRGFTWTITFSDPATGGDVEMLTITTALTGQNVQARMFETVKGNQLGGTFQLKFNGETTGPILFSADKDAVQAQLNSLASIKPSSVLVDRTGPAITAANQVLSYTWLITFRSSTWVNPTDDHSSGIIGNWKGPRAKWDDVWPETGYSKAWGRHVGPMWTNNYRITCIKDGLTTTANDRSEDCTTAEAVRGVGPIKGTFRLRLDSMSALAAPFMAERQNALSDPIPHNAWATRAESGATGTSLEEILERMANIGDVAVSRSAVNRNTGGYSWTITFLRDVTTKCEQLEDLVPGVTPAGQPQQQRLCNSAGNIPPFVPDGTGLSGSTPLVTVCEAGLGNCGAGVVQDGRILRGDFTTFKVTGDPGFESRYFLTVACPGGAAPPCNPVQFLSIAAGSEDIADHLALNDRFTIGTHTACVFTVKDITAAAVEVIPLSCASMVAGMTNNPMGVFMRVPWNADESLVKRVLEASSDKSKETGVWINGRTVSVTRTIHGKYGEVSWRVRFISNPTYTPPGAGNIPDITTTFLANPTTPDRVTVTQITPGSVGLSGSFLIDFRSTFGPREIQFDETEERLQRKLNEMNTIGRVIVKKFAYPSKDTGCLDSTCSGGWDDQPVDVPGTRGGYRWRVRFLKVTGEYGGLTFPSGSGNVGPLSVTLGSLQGNDKSVDVTTNSPGSPPILGTFALTSASKMTPLMPYASSADSLKQGIEAMNLFGEVDVTRDVLVMQRIPKAVATISKDGLAATINFDTPDDIRQYLAPGDLVRFGPTTGMILPGTNGDSPITGDPATSRVVVSALSPIVIAPIDVTKVIFPSMTLRIDGLVYSVQRSGHEIQTVSVTLPTASWDPNEVRGYFKLTLRRHGSSQTTPTCFAFNADAGTLSDKLNAQLALLDATVTAQQVNIRVTRTGPKALIIGGAARTGYVFSIYFLGNGVMGNVATLTSDFTGCTSIPNAQVDIATVTHGGQIPQQRLSLASDGGLIKTDTGGYFKLGANGVSTGCLSWGIQDSDLEMQLENTLNTGNVLVTRRGSGVSGFGGATASDDVQLGCHTDGDAPFPAFASRWMARQTGRRVSRTASPRTTSRMR